MTQGQWLALMGENPSYFNEGKVGEEWRNHPVETVSWDDCQDFIKVLNKRSPSTGSGRSRNEEDIIFRLPSEAQWEYVCRASSETVWHFGNDKEQLEDYAWFGRNSGDGTHPVGQLRSNAWGLYDMLGNVWEWCEDVWHDGYKGAPSDGSAWLENGENYKRLLRGESWDCSSWYVRCAFRDGVSSYGRNDDVGFRVLCSSLASRTL